RFRFGRRSRGYAESGSDGPPSSPERRFQKVATPTALAIRRATALLFGFFVSVSIAGTASFAFFFSTRLPTAHATHPTAALRRLKTPMPGPYKRKEGPALCGKSGAPGECREPCGRAKAPGGTRARPLVKTPAPRKS